MGANYPNMPSDGSGFPSDNSHYWGITINDPNNIIYLVKDGSVLYDIWHGSDRRIKSNIMASTLDCLSIVKTIPLAQFTSAAGSNPTPIGFIAQDVHAVAAYLVQQGDAASTAGGPGTVIWNIQSNNMLAILVGAIKQLAAHVGA